MASLQALILGNTVAVFYSDDNLWHERLLLWRFSEGVWYVLTPDKDVYAEDLRCLGEDSRPWTATFRRRIREAHQLGLREDGFDGAWRPLEILNMDGQRKEASGFLGGLLVSRRLVRKQPTPSLPTLGRRPDSSSFRLASPGRQSLGCLRELGGRGQGRGSDGRSPLHGLRSG